MIQSNFRIYDLKNDETRHSISLIKRWVSTTGEKEALVIYVLEGDNVNGACSFCEENFDSTYCADGCIEGDIEG